MSQTHNYKNVDGYKEQKPGFSNEKLQLTRDGCFYSIDFEFGFKFESDTMVLFEIGLRGIYKDGKELFTQNAIRLGERLIEDNFKFK